MKKNLKKILIILLAILLAAAAIYGAKVYHDKKATCEVVGLQYYAMDSYFGDELQSSGTVTSDQAQMVYASSSNPVKEICVAEGDSVKEGDLLMRVESEQDDVAGKALELQQAKQQLAVDQVKLNRLLEEKPVADQSKIKSVDATKEEEYTYLRTFYANGSVTESFEDADGNSVPITYSDGDLVAEFSYDYQGNIISTTYYDTYGNTIMNYTGSDPSVDDGTNYRVEAETSIYSWTAGTYYYDGDTKELLGKDIYDENGNLISSYTPESGYTAEELSEAISDARSQVQKEDLSVRMLENQLTYLKENVNTGEIRAKVSGSVKKVQDSHNINYNNPVITISGTDDYFISGSLGEMDLKSVSVGDSVTITSWDDGTTAEGVITEIDDYPSKEANSNYYTTGNSNVSVYAFKASFSYDSGISLGAAVDITIGSSSEESGLFLSNFFVREDASGAYVMKEGEDGRLLRVPVTLGRTIWGSYYEILDGDVTMNDYLAFPYGTGAISGTKCVETDSIE